MHLHGSYKLRSACSNCIEPFTGSLVQVSYEPRCSDDVTGVPRVAKRKSMSGGHAGWPTNIADSFEVGSRVTRLDHPMQSLNSVTCGIENIERISTI